MFMKNVLIMGGASDIGMSLANYFKNSGYRVIVGYHNNYQDREDIIFIKCDIKSELDIENTIKTVINDYGKIDILVNLASVSRDNSFLNKTKDEFMEVLEVNLVGTFLCNQIYSRYISNGLIINMGSTDGIDTYSEYSLDYGISKSGIINLTKWLSKYTPNKIICLCPNWIDSDSTRSMNKKYLNSELERIKQSRLITLDELNESIDKILTSDIVGGEVYRIDIKDDKVWIEKEH